MKLMKSALLGSATALVAVASAQAADLPSTKSAPVEYVRVCDVYGAGFFYIPGTQTCLRVGGRVRFELAAQSVKNGYVTRSAGGAVAASAAASLAANFRGKNGMDSFGWNSRGYLNMDARTQSAWGTVQTVIIMRVNSNSGVLNNSYATGGLNAGNAFSATLENAYIRFAGFTFGRAYSNVLPIPPYMWNTDQVGGFGAGIKQLAYTATFGGGFSATIGIEDAKDSGPAGTYNALGGNGAAAGALLANGLGGGALTVSGNGPTRLPNAFANIRVDQAWGWAQLSGVIGQNTANIATTTPANPALLVNGANGPLLKKTGWAVNGAARINLPMLAAGDHLHLAAAYANGLINYAGPEVNGGLGKIGPWNAGLLRNDRNVTAFCANAACTLVGTENTKAWSILAMFTHYWTPTVRQNFSASYQVVTPGSVTQATDVIQGGLSKARVLSLGSNVIWSPVAGFDIGLELSYARLNQRVVSSVAQINAFNAAVVGLPGAPSLKASSNVFGARMRVERTF